MTGRRVSKFILDKYNLVNYSTAGLSHTSANDIIRCNVNIENYATDLTIDISNQYLQQIKHAETAVHGQAVYFFEAKVKAMAMRIHQSRQLAKIFLTSNAHMIEVDTGI